MAIQALVTCAYRGCSAPVTASVLAGATRIEVCFTHEREYADRYGCSDIHPLQAPKQAPMSPFVRAALSGSLRMKELSIDPQIEVGYAYVG